LPDTNTICPECGGKLVYDPVTGYYSCTSCGLSATRAQLATIREKKREAAFREKSRHQEYLDWWTSSKKR
jgi:uncharacterized Zn finger protein (UPF0148 family)